MITFCCLRCTFCQQLEVLRLIFRSSDRWLQANILMANRRRWHLDGMVGTEKKGTKVGSMQNARPTGGAVRRSSADKELHGARETRKG